MSLEGKLEFIRVESYSGYKADEKPVRFIFSGKKFTVKRLIGQWRGPDSDYFKVEAGDGREFLLVHNYIKDKWVMEKIFE